MIESTQSAAITTSKPTFATFRRFAFPILMGSTMPIAMTLQQGGSFLFPGFLMQLVVTVLLAISLGAFILPMRQISTGFTRLLRLSKPRWLNFVVSQIPGAIIFSIVMGAVANMMHMGINLMAMKNTLLGLPSGIVLALMMEIIISIVLDYVVKPMFFKPRKSRQSHALLDTGFLIGPNT